MVSDWVGTYGCIVYVWFCGVYAFMCGCVRAREWGWRMVFLLWQSIVTRLNTSAVLV